MLYNEPLQGCVGDCAFIAALSAVALAAKASLRLYNNYAFYSPEKGIWESVKLLDNKLAVDINNNIVYARTSTTYIWPCLYEKAYAKWKDPNHNDPPDIGAILAPGGGGLTALLHICGGVYYQRQLRFFKTGKTQYPTIASTNGNPGMGLTPNHTYTVTGRSGTGYELRNPCGGGLFWVSAINVNSFEDWGYVIP